MKFHVEVVKQTQHSLIQTPGSSVSNLRLLEPETRFLAIFYDP